MWSRLKLLSIYHNRVIPLAVTRSIIYSKILPIVIHCIFLFFFLEGVKSYLYCPPNVSILFFANPSFLLRLFYYFLFGKTRFTRSTDLAGLAIRASQRGMAAHFFLKTEFDFWSNIFKPPLFIFYFLFLILQISLILLKSFSQFWWIFITFHRDSSGFS